MADLSMWRGDTLVFDVTITDEDGAAVNLIGTSLRLTAKRSAGQPDADALISLTTGAGITVTNASAGQARVEIVPAKTSGLEAATVSLVWDLQLTTGDGQVFTVAGGYLTVSPDVSHASP